MRKLGRENRKMFVILSVIVAIIIILFIYFIRIALSFDRNVYTIEAGTTLFNEKYEKIIPKEDATLKKGFDGKYHLATKDNKKYTLGDVVIASKKTKSAIDLYGIAYQVTTNGEIVKVNKKTSIPKTSPAKFYKLADRKYLFVDGTIHTEDNQISENDYLIIELNKQGSPTLVNEDINFKTVKSIVLKGSIFDFDVANEKLIYNNKEINLKDIIGSTNEYKENKESGSKTQNNSSSNFSNDTQGNNKQNGSNNYYDDYYKKVVTSFNNLTNSVSNINDNTKDTIKEGDIYFDFSHWISLKKIDSSVTSITIDYTVFDPNNEYQSIFLLFDDGNEKSKIQLDKNNSSYYIRNLNPNSEYTISLGYSLVGDEAETYTDTVKIKTKKPTNTLKITKLTRNQIYYKIKIDDQYVLDSAEIVLYSDGKEINKKTVNINSAKSGYTDFMTYENLGQDVEIRLENTIYNGTSVSLDVQDKIINR